jgi:predicted PurR-regulated permease PerM
MRATSVRASGGRHGAAYFEQRVAQPAAIDRGAANGPKGTGIAHPATMTARRELSLGVLVGMAAIGVVLCVLMVRPFVPGLTGALALAVMAMPFHRWLLARLKWPNIVAGISVAAVALVLLTPAVFLGYRIGRTATEGLDLLEQHIGSGQWRQTLSRFPVMRSTLEFFNREQTPEQTTREIVPVVKQQAALSLPTVLWSGVHIAIALFTLFFLLRDRVAILAAIRRLLPMADDEATYFFQRISGMTRATLYGTVVTAVAQGALGGLMFYAVGISGALLWGVAMAALSMVPTLGAFIIWVPAAIYLAMQGHWTKAVIVGAWGAIVVSSIDNILFPSLVGKEIRLHTLPVFLAVIGGLALFGAAGLVLGPVTLAATVALLDIIRRRTVRAPSTPLA